MTTRRDLAIPLAIVGALMIATAVVFTFTDLDRTITALFHVPADRIPDRWPLEDWWVVKLFYHGAPAFMGALAVAALGGIILGGLVPRYRRWQVYGLFILVSVALGPGLMVNLGFKDNWGRPRPRDITTFGGDAQYLPHTVPANPGRGKSFPCGHCSVGFTFGVFWLILRRRHPLAGRCCLYGAIGFGLCLGLMRVVTGSHFTSDALWAGYLSFTAILLAYYVIVKVPRRIASVEAKPAEALKPGPLSLVGYGALATALGVGILLATPVSESFTVPMYQPVAGEPLPERLEVSTSRGDIRIEVVPAGTLPEPLVIEADIRGFGLPIHRITSERPKVRADGTVTYTLDVNGVFTELNVAVTTRIEAGAFTHVTANAPQGRVRFRPHETIDEGLLPTVLENELVD